MSKALPGARPTAYPASAISRLMLRNGLNDLQELSWFDQTGEGDEHPVAANDCSQGLERSGLQAMIALELWVTQVTVVESPAPNHPQWAAGVDPGCEGATSHNRTNRRTIA